MSRPIFYPPCQFLNLDRRDARRHFYCEKRHLYVSPSTSVKDADLKFNRNHCGPDCPDRSGKTRVPTL